MLDAAEGGAGVHDELAAGDLARQIREQPHHRIGPKVELMTLDVCLGIDSYVEASAAR